MTLRTPTARPVDTYVRPDTSSLTHLTERQRQTQNAFKQLGVHFATERKAANKELEVKMQAESNNKFREINAEIRPEISEAMARPDTYAMSPEDFLQSDTFRNGYDKLGAGIKSPVHRAEFQSKYKDSMLKMFTDGKVKQEASDREHSASLAQQSAADAQGISGQMAAYDDSVASGISRDDAFTAGFATASLKGIGYLKQFHKARNWTPEEDLRIQKHLKSLVKKGTNKSSFALRYANSFKDPAKKLEALSNVASTYGDVLTAKQKGNLAVDVQILNETLQAESAVQDNLLNGTANELNHWSKQGGREVSKDRINEFKDNKWRQAAKSGDYQTLSLLARNPTDIPKAAKEQYSAQIALIAKGDVASLETAESLIFQTDALFNSVGPAVVESMIGTSGFSNYMSFKGMYDQLDDPESAIEQFAELKRLEASGTGPVPEKWNETVRTSVSMITDHFNKSGINPTTWIGANDREFTVQETGDALSQFIPLWKKQGLTEDQMVTAGKAIINGRSWGGVANGGLLGASMDNLGSKGRKKSGLEVLNDGMTAMTKEVQQVLPDIEDLTIKVVGPTADTVILQDSGGLIVPNSIMKLSEFTEKIEALVPTVKEELETKSAEKKAIKDATIAEDKVDTSTLEQHSATRLFNNLPQSDPNNKTTLKETKRAADARHGEAAGRFEEDFPLPDA